MLHIVLYQPEIPPNTGNIIRLAANCGAQLHLIHPLGFQLEEKSLRRAGLDYREWARIKEYDNYNHFMTTAKPQRLFACTTKATQYYSAVQYQDQDFFIFGPETRGLPAEMLQTFALEHKIKIPMQPESRSLNLSNAVAIIVYEAWRQLMNE
ncbi:MAG: tRNA (uridine(34)/cytosine(34)/5-carboxymethylaminomethyluridine(34)-2'-O)-methyltransferase TrmL [Coxiella sp. RIFCSPHIGHO2_12_FULL_42_15]|nr:MAG: tRNA (uridine(34)/cytosine(34)/5-carboxymethylaminomethyluridine(34)-2'-O)-methyltransferase TrmL [Coxiella sp. RIFCSPHIGHO2_12_FULL_42_15]